MLFLLFIFLPKIAFKGILLRSNEFCPSENLDKDTKKIGIK